jgi:hypothetical protein
VIGVLQVNIDQVSKMQPEQMRAIFRVLGISDDGLPNVVTEWEGAVAKDAVLASSRVPEDDPRRKGLRAQKEALQAGLAQQLASIRENWQTRLEIEKMNLQKIQERLAAARDANVKGKEKLSSYVGAKTAYLQQKRIFEAMNLKLSTLILENGIEW